MAYQPRMAMTPQSPTSNPFYTPYMLGDEHSTLPLELVYGLKDDSRDDQGFNLGAMMASGGGSVDCPPTPPMDGSVYEGLDHLHPGSTAFTQDQNGVKKNVRRRIQNRDAQRRFRERKDQLQRTLQQRADDILADYRLLCDEHDRSTTEVSRLLEENHALRSEVEKLRQQWCLMQTVVMQSTASTSTSANVSPSTSTRGDAGFFDDGRCFLGDFSDESSPHIMS